MNDIVDPGNEREPEGRKYGVPKERDRVIQLLQRAYAAGDLELDDYENRVKLAEDASTIDQLRAVVADFPDYRVTPVPPGSSPVAETAGPFLFTLLGDREVLPDDLEQNAASVLAIIGDVKVDLSGTRAPEGTTFDITTVSFIGDTKIIVPRGTRIVRRQFNVLGSYKRRAEQPEPGSERYTLVLRGFKLIGDVKIRER